MMPTHDLDLTFDSLTFPRGLQSLLTPVLANILEEIGRAHV